jgi:diguanylate cyclase (GGDEF)-like protein/PAS domain S-box-containing protein
LLFDAFDRLCDARNSRNVVAILSTSVRELAAADGVTVMLRDEEEVRYLSDGCIDPLWRSDRFPLDSSIAGLAITSRQHALIEEIAGDARLAAEICPNAPIKSLAVLPIRSADPIGAIAVCWKETPPELPMDELQMLANAAAISLENARLFGWAEVAYRLAKQEAMRYSNLVNTVSGVVWEADPASGRFTFVGGQAEALLGFPVNEWTNTDDFWLAQLHPQDREWARTARHPAPGAGDRHHIEYRMIAADGRIVWVSDYISAVRNSDDTDDTDCLRGVMVDITEKKRLEQRLSWQALYDSLTNLPNRDHFLARVENEISGIWWRGGERVAVLLVDLDRFQHVNDSYGRIIGDTILSAVAARLRRSVGNAESVARLDGDQFAILVPADADRQQARAVAERVHGQFALPFWSGNGNIYLTASIGIALSDGAPRTASDLVREAGTAMYQARNSGRARSKFFHASMHESAVSRFALESDLRRAVARRELELHYQPIVELRTRRVLGYETLLRWPHARRGLLLPADFLTAAEETGLMIELGYHAIERACAILRRWNSPDGASPWISVNLSPVQLADPSLPRYIRAVLDRHCVAPEGLKVEITEAAMAQGEAAVVERLRQLHEMGVGIFIDDFGTGTSAFSRLLNAPVEIIKIDRTFVNEIAENGSDAPLLRSIISLGRNLKVRLVAEGVENETQAARLEELGCEWAQGFYFARPGPLRELELTQAS